MPESLTATPGAPETRPPGGSLTPLFGLAVALWSGIAIALLLPPDPTRAIAGVAAALAAIFALLAASRNARSSSAAGVATALVLLAAFFAGGASRPPEGDRTTLAQTARGLGDERLTRPVRLEGVLTRDPADQGSSTRLELAVGRLAANRATHEVSGDAVVRVRGGRRDRLRELARGDRITVWARWSEPRPPSSPGRPPGDSSLAFTGSTKSALLVTKTEDAGPLGRAIFRARVWVRSRLATAGDLAPTSRTLAAALLIGDRPPPDSPLTRAFRDAGTIHVMAVSGLHVGILGGLVYWLLVLSGVRRSTALAALLIVLPLYAALSGARPPVVRAVVMAALVVLAYRRGLFPQALNGLGLAAVALLAFAPWNAADAGFQLSFAATAAIIVALTPPPPEERTWERPHRIRRALAAPVIVTAAATLVTMPIIAWHFRRVAPVGLLASIPATLLAAPVIGSAIAFVLLADIPLLGVASEAVLDLSAGALVRVSETFAAAPGGAFPVARPSPVWMLAWAGLAVLLLGLRNAGIGRRVRNRIRVGAAVGILFLFALLPPGGVSGVGGSGDGSLRLTALDVGHGDALVVELPAGGAVLVDAGTEFEGFSAGERIVAPFLAERGYRRLRLAVLSHGDLDHVGGFRGVLRDVGVDEIWAGSAAEDSRSAVVRFRREAEGRGVPFRRLRRGERIAVGGASFSVLLAGDLVADLVARAGDDRSVGSNDESLVLALDYADRRILLTGDAGAMPERLLVERHPEEIRADILKVGHHGSRTSTTEEFLAAVEPEIAIVSGRRDPRRSLPSEDVLNRLEESGARILRTDLDGTVTVVVRPDGALEVEAFLDRAPTR